MPSRAPPLAFLSQRNLSGTLKLSFHANPATSSQARKQEMSARTAPIMAIGESSNVRLRGTPGSSQTTSVKTTITITTLCALCTAMPIQALR